MRQCKIILNKVRDIYDLAQISQKCEHTVSAEQGDFCVNAKSALGLFSLDLTSPIVIEWDDSCESDNTVISTLLQRIAETSKEENGYGNKRSKKRR